MTDFAPHYRLVAARGAQPTSWLLVAHGLFGSGDNWATFARQVVERRPDWGLVLVDLRMHGKSRGAPPPHTITAAAADLALLAGRLAGDGVVVRASAGHSLGGKVALELRASARVPLVQTWVFDASPGVCAGCAVDPDNPVVRVLAALEALPEEYERREEFVDAMARRGFPTMVARWLAKNVASVGGRYRFDLDLGAMRSLLVDYYARELWVNLDELGVDETVCFVVAGASEVVDAADRERLRWLEAESSGQVRVHVLEGASHWLHVDARASLVERVAGELPGL